MILAYHNINDNIDDFWAVSPSKFDEDMAWMRDNGYRGVPLSQGTAILEYGSDEVKDKTVMLTFDDGYKDFIEVAVPILEKYGFKATVFIVTDEEHSTWRKKELQTELMDWDNIRILATSGYEIGSHGLKHTRLTTLSNIMLECELRESKNKLEDKIDRLVVSFSYPWCGYNDHVVGYVKQAGYKYAVAGDNGCDDLLALKRRGMHKPDKIQDVLA